MPLLSKERLSVEPGMNKTEGVKLSVVIICWNDGDCILDCIQSVYRAGGSISLEIIVTDNGSTDDSIARIRQQFPGVIVIENGRNLGFGAGNNAGFRMVRGEYVLVLNPDTVVQPASLETLLQYADVHGEGGAFGCRVLNPDGSLQSTAQPVPTAWRYLIAALYLRWLGRWSEIFQSDQYVGWDGCTDREIGFQAACCLLVRRELLRQLEGFDETILHQFEDADLCYRIWKSGKKVMFCHDACITHIGGRNRGLYPIDVVLDTEKSKCRFFQKHFGARGLTQIRLISLLSLALRYSGYRLAGMVRRDSKREARLEEFRTLLDWYWNWDTHNLNGAGERQLAPNTLKVSH